jgi:hypothetical protein
MIIRIILFTLILSTFSSCATGQRTVKWNKAITSIEKSEFVERYLEEKEKIESEIASYKRNDFLDSSDETAMENGYLEAKSMFDAVLNRMKFSFTDKATRKTFSNNPDLILDGLRYDLDNAIKTYKNNCQTYLDFGNESTIGAFGLSEISLLLGLFSEVGKLISNNISNTKKMSGEYFEDNFLYKLRLKDWDTY